MSAAIGGFLIGIFLGIPFGFGLSWFLVDAWGRDDDLNGWGE